jgi:ferrous iron transport protein A
VSTVPASNPARSSIPISTLAELSIGSRGCVIEVAGDDEISLRLMEMGLVPGTILQVVGVAPLGDPIEIEIRGYRLSLRRTEASRVALGN